MKTSVNRELKYYANSFDRIRSTLDSLGAKLSEKKEQTDYFYNTLKKDYLLKLRIESNKKKLVYYYPTYNAGQRQVSFEVWKIQEGNFKDILDSVLELRGVVKKEREIWRKDNIIFHLDKVRGVGDIFEIESEDVSEGELEELKKLFMPYLGRQINSSNIDLIYQDS